MLLVELIHAIYYWGLFCGAPLIWLILFVAFRNRLNKFVLLGVFLLVPILIVSVLRFTNDAAMDLTANLAIPYIQEALDEQCSDKDITAHAQSYSSTLDFGTTYSDGQVSCRYDNSWVCECLP